MKTRKSILALVILLVLVFMQGQAEGGGFWSGNDLVERMREWDKEEAGVKGVSYADAGIYVGYVAGVFDALGGIMWKSQDNVTIGQTCSIVSKYLKNHPEMWNKPAVNLIVDALKEAFPLPKKK